MHSIVHTKKNRNQRLKAAFGCWGIHVGLCMIVAVALLIGDVTDYFGVILISYMYLGWIPLAIWLYPYLKKNIE